MERILHTVILNDGLPLDICEQIREYDEGVNMPGLKLIRVAGGQITLPDAHALLKAHGHADVIERFNIPAY